MRTLARRPACYDLWRRLHLVACVVMALAPSAAWALILGGTGNTPLKRPDWPAGAAAVFDSPSRVAYWEGPPYGGGHWNSECRGDAAALNVVLADFAKLDVKNRRVVLHDGVGASFWLSTAQRGKEPVDARVDWIFRVWAPKNWERLQGFPPDLRGPEAGSKDEGPPAILDIYTGGNVKWSDVQVPDSLIVDDQRLSAHGFTTEDGVVLEGKLLECETNRPLPGRVRLERMESGDDGRLTAVLVAQVQAAADGRWFITKTPAGRHRLTAEAEGKASRVVGYVASNGQASWTSFPSRLAPTAQVAGQVVDESGKPLANATVQLADVTAGPDGRYDLPFTAATTSDDAGRFRLTGVPQGNARILVHKSGYCRPGLGLTVKTPTERTSLSMQPAAQVRVTVKFPSDPPPGYVVKIAPEEGEAVGRWSGSGQIDVNREMAFHDVPPGRYVLRGRPNPGGDDQETPPLPVTLVGGQTHQVELKAK